MYMTKDIHRRGLDEGMEIALRMINETLETHCNHLGEAIAHVDTINRQRKWLKQDLETMRDSYMQLAEQHKNLQYHYDCAILDAKGLDYDH
jgi:cell division protein FtsB